MEVVGEYAGVLANGLATTVLLNLATYVSGAVVGIAAGLMLCSGYAPLRWLARAYVELIRNTPFLIQAMIIFAGFAVAGLRLHPVYVGWVALTVYAGAYIAEIVRGGLASVPRAQWETATALGIRGWHTVRLVILPQTYPFVVPATTNLFAALLKESSLLSALAVSELTFAGQVMLSDTFLVVPALGIVGITYFFLITLIVSVSHIIESRLAWMAKRDSKIKSAFKSEAASTLSL